MRCRECSSCQKGWFASMPDSHVCIGVKNPFVIDDINAECIEYPEKRNKQFGVADSLVVTYDNCPPDVPTLTVARRDKYDMTILNKVQGDEAFAVYRYLTGGTELKLKPKEGKWTLNKDGSGTCDQCRFTQKDVWDYDNYQNYCGVCGAKMSI